MQLEAKYTHTIVHDDDDSYIKELLQSELRQFHPKYAHIIVADRWLEKDQTKRFRFAKVHGPGSEFCAASNTAERGHGPISFMIDCESCKIGQQCPQGCQSCTVVARCPYLTKALKMSKAFSRESIERALRLQDMKAKVILDESKRGRLDRRRCYQLEQVVEFLFDSQRDTDKCAHTRPDFSTPIVVPAAGEADSAAEDEEDDDMTKMTSSCRGAINASNLLACNGDRQKEKALLSSRKRFRERHMEPTA